MAKLKQPLKIGILGGTFNPPHLGHLMVAKHVLNELNLDKILFIPTNIPPHKVMCNIDSKHRVEMVKLAIKNNDKFILNLNDIKRTGKTYTIDTINDLIKNEKEQVEYYFIIGDDLSGSLSEWKDINKLKKLIHFVSVSRSEVSNLKSDPDLIKIEIAPIDISSTEIRKKVSKHHPIIKLVPEAVNKYIKDHHLYEH